MIDFIYSLLFIGDMSLLTRDRLLSHFPIKPVVCQSLSKFGMFTCVCHTYNGFRSIFLLK